MIALDGTIYRPMASAPKTDAGIFILTRSGEYLSYYYDCAWLRQTDPDTKDCWRPVESWRNDIELHEALGWRPEEG